VTAFFQEFFQFGVYKRSQGRITRQVTFAALMIVVALGLWRLSETLRPMGISARLPGFYLWLPGALLAVWAWISYRVVNVPIFADFLIAVEAEMNKVSWPTRTELVRASIVVLLCIFTLALVLAGFDLFWRFAFTITGVFS
jgi:preprotein translocase subunit SecE